MIIIYKKDVYNFFLFFTNNLNEFKWGNFRYSFRSFVANLISFCLFILKYKLKNVNIVSCIFSLYKFKRTCYGKINILNIKSLIFYL